MATTAITINIDNTLLPTATDALAWKGGYQATITDNNPASPTYGQQIPNPVTKNAFAKNQIIGYVKNAIVDYQAMQAQVGITPPSNTLIS